MAEESFEFHGVSQVHAFLPHIWGEDERADAAREQHGLVQRPGVVVRNTFIDVRAAPDCASDSEESPSNSPKQRKRNVSAPPSPTRQRTPWHLRAPGHEAVDGSDQEELDEDQVSIPSYLWSPNGGLVQGGAGDEDILTATLGNPNSPKRVVLGGERAIGKFWREPPPLGMPDAAGGPARVSLGSMFRSNRNPAMDHVPILGVDGHQPLVGEPCLNLDAEAALAAGLGQASEIDRMDLSLGPSTAPRRGLGLGGGFVLTPGGQLWSPLQAEEPKTTPAGNDGQGIDTDPPGFREDLWHGFSREQENRGPQFGDGFFLRPDGLSTEAPADARWSPPTTDPTLHHKQTRRFRRDGKKQGAPAMGSDHSLNFDDRGNSGKGGRIHGFNPAPAFPDAVVNGFAPGFSSHQLGYSGQGAYPPGQQNQHSYPFGQSGLGPYPQGRPGNNPYSLPSSGNAFNGLGIAAGSEAVGPVIGPPGVQHHSFAAPGDVSRGVYDGFDAGFDCGISGLGRNGRQGVGKAAGRGRGRGDRGRGRAANMAGELGGCAEVGGGKGQPFVMQGAAAAAAALAAEQEPIPEDALHAGGSGPGRVSLTGGGPKRTDYIRKFGAQGDESGQSAVPITTMMLKNIPCRKSQEEVMLHIDRKNFGGRYDFFYLPHDVKFRANLGYAFINFLTAEDASRFQAELSGYRFEGSSSVKACIAAPAHVQGLINNVAAFKRTEVMRSNRKPYFAGVVTL